MFDVQLFPPPPLNRTPRQIHMKNLTGKITIIAVIALIVLLIKFFGLDQYLTLAHLKDFQTRFTEYYTTNPLPVMVAFFGIYVLVTALSIPGAVIMTLAGGAFFGLVTGTIIISFASTIGATLACIISRFLLRDWVQGKFGDKLKAINDGVDREGAFYLFTMRLIPIFPFFVINLVMGLTKMPIRTYFWVSQLGMFPGTIVYVNAGRELSRIDSLAGIMSPRLLFAFVLLGILPLISKKIIGWYRAKQGDTTVKT